MTFIHENTDLMDAVLDIDFNRVKELVKRGHDVDYAEHDGWTLLDQASLDDSQDIVDYLILKGATIEV